MAYSTRAWPPSRSFHFALTAGWVRITIPPAPFLETLKVLVPQTSPSAFWKRWLSLLIIGGVVLPVTLFQPYVNGPPIRSDGIGYHVWTYALLSGRLSFRWYPGNPAEAGLHLADAQRSVFQNKYPPGVALLRLPFMLFWIDRSQAPAEISSGEHWTVLVLGAVALLGTVFFTLKSCVRLGAPLWASHTAVLLLTFGTGLFHYATYDASFSHIYSALGVALLLWLSVQAAYEKEGRLPLITTVLTTCLLLLVRNTNAVFLLLWGVAYLMWFWRSAHASSRLGLRNAAIMAAGFFLGAAIQLAINAYANGHFMLSSYGEESFMWDRPMLLSVLFSYERGLFTYYPVLAVVLLAAIFVKPVRAAAVGLAGLFLVYAALYGFWDYWMLGGGFGHRGFVEFVPLAVPLLALSLLHYRVQPQSFILAAAVASVCLTLSIMAAYWHGTFPFGGANATMYWSNSFRLDRVVRLWFDARITSY